MGEHVSKQGGKPPKQIDVFSAQVRNVNRARRLDEEYHTRLGVAISVNLFRNNTKMLDNVATNLENRLDPASENPLSEDMYARLWGSWMVAKNGSTLIKEARKTGKSLREVAADERNSTRPTLRERRHETLRTALNTAVEDVLTDHTVQDIMLVAMLAASAVATADQEDITMAATHLDWLKHQASILASSNPDFAPLPHIADGILDVVKPALDKTQVLVAAAA